MAVKYEITAEQRAEIEKARLENKNKRIEARLKVLCMRADGKTALEIGDETGYHSVTVSAIVSRYVHGGLEAISGRRHRGRIDN